MAEQGRERASSSESAGDTGDSEGENSDLFLFFYFCIEEKRRSKAESELAAARRALATHEKKIQTLKHYCSMNQKERNALRTIMEVCSLLPPFLSFFLFFFFQHVTLLLLRTIMEVCSVLPPFFLHAHFLVSMNFCQT